jgi:hypothetical protein
MSFDLKITNGDFSINQSGSLNVVRDNEKLIQAILKICLTDCGSNPLHSWYGSYLSQSSIGNALPFDVTSSMIKSQLQSALDVLLKIQELQYYSTQKVTSNEMMHSILKLDVQRDITDFRLYTILIVVLTKGFKPVTTEFAIAS